MYWRAFPVGFRHISVRFYVCETTRCASAALPQRANWPAIFIKMARAANFYSIIGRFIFNKNTWEKYKQEQIKHILFVICWWSSGKTCVSSSWQTIMMSIDPSVTCPWPVWMSISQTHMYKAGIFTSTGLSSLSPPETVIVTASGWARGDLLAGELTPQFGSS